MREERTMTTITEKMRVPEAAAYLRLAPSTLAKLRCSGGGPPFSKAGGRVVIYDKTRLDEWLAGRLCRSTSEYGSLDERPS
jgi:hypothetical protein